MEDQKLWFQSRAIIGSIVTILALVAGAFNYVIDAQTQVEIVDLVMVLVGVAGSVLAIFGRVKASKKIQ